MISLSWKGTKIPAMARMSRNPDTVGEAVESSSVAAARAFHQRQTMATSDRSGDIQFGVLPYRVSAAGATEVMLLTSRGVGRWVIPKGWPMIGRKPRAVAVTEARQEAGIKGIIGRRPIGSYHYTKSIERGEDRLCECVVFPMLVTHEAPTWREQGQRTRAWFQRDEAAQLVNEGALAEMIRNLLQVSRLVRAT
jgi:ADP-ribose pyrophosphatase YjhB (NUDIX family)